MRFLLAGAVALLLVGCGDTGPTQAQKAADAYASAFKTQAGKVLNLSDQVSADCTAVKRDACINGIIAMATAAKDAPGALPAAPGCMSAADTKARAGFSQIEQGSVGSIDALAVESDAQIQATSSAIRAGADQILAAATDIGKAKC